MKVFRSQYWFKKKKGVKTWFADFKNLDLPTSAARTQFDIKRFMAHTGLVKEVVGKMFDEAVQSDTPKELWLEKYGWTMQDMGLTEI